MYRIGEQISGEQYLLRTRSPSAMCCTRGQRPSKLGSGKHLRSFHQHGSGPRMQPWSWHSTAPDTGCPTAKVSCGGLWVLSHGTKSVIRMACHNLWSCERLTDSQQDGRFVTVRCSARRRPEALPTCNYAGSRGWRTYPDSGRPCVWVCVVGDSGFRSRTAKTGASMV